MSTKTKIRIVTFMTLLFCLMLPLVQRCDAQCVCLPRLPMLPLPCWCCCQPCQPVPSAKPQQCAKSVVEKPEITPIEKKCPTCPAVPSCGTCHKAAAETGNQTNQEQTIPAEEPEDLPLVEDIACAPEGTDAEVAACFNCLNELRRRMGLPLVQLDEALCKMAQQHCDRMASFRAMFHSGCGFAENVAFGNSSGQRTFEQWHRSPGHLQNLLRAGTRVGIARCGIYWTFVIGR